MTKTVKLSFDTVILIAFAFAAIESLGFSAGARWLPLVVSIAGGALAAINLAMDAVNALRHKGADAEDKDFDADVRGALRWFLWLIGYAALIFLVGFLIATPLWVGAFFRTEAKARWRFTIISMVAVVVVLLLFSEYLPLELPPGILIPLN